MSDFNAPKPVLATSSEPKSADNCVAEKNAESALKNKKDNKKRSDKKGKVVLKNLKTNEYRVAKEVNAGKLARVEAVYAELCDIAKATNDQIWDIFNRHGHMPFNIIANGANSEFPVTSLGASSKDCLAVHLKSQAQSWLTNLKTHFARVIEKSCKDESLNRQLHWINSFKAWTKPYAEQGLMLQEYQEAYRTAVDLQEKYDEPMPELSIEASRIMRKLYFKRLEKAAQPTAEHPPLTVNVNSCTFGAATRSKYQHFGFWLSITGLEKNFRIMLPLQTNPYAKNRKNIINTKSTYSLIKKDEQWVVLQTVEQEATPLPGTNKSKVLGLDIGLNNLLVTSEGEHFGTKVSQRLKVADKRMLRALKAAQKNRLRPSQSENYVKEVRYVRGLLKTNIYTAVKRLVQRHRPGVVSIEKLTYFNQSKKLSRRMNRLVRNIGYGYLKEALSSYAKAYGFKVQEVNSAYTSQECVKCHFTHFGNRNENVFKCLSCGHLAHADVNAAKNIARRSGDETAQSSADPSVRQHAWQRLFSKFINKSDERRKHMGLLRHQRSVDLSVSSGLIQLQCVPRYASLIKESFDKDSTLRDKTRSLCLDHRFNLLNSLNTAKSG